MKRSRIINKNQAGISLPISLFVLLGILLSAMLLLRSGDSSVTVAGNIGARAQVGGSNDHAIGVAFDWLVANKENLDDDDFANGYFSANAAGRIDYSNWLNAKVLPKDEMGNVNSYRIIRMCSIPNAARNESVDGRNNVCHLETKGDGVSTDTSSVGYGSFNYTQEASVIAILYKIVVKTVGPKGATVITETVVSI